MKTVNKQIQELQQEVKILKQSIKGLLSKTKDPAPPYSKVGSNRSRSNDNPADVRAGLVSIYGGSVMWNNADASKPPLNQLPPTPEEGYNKHFHGRHSGGALDINSLELVEYDYENGTDVVGYNPDCQQYWRVAPPIMKENEVEKIGKLDIEFDSSSKKWIAGSGAINVKTTKIVEYAWYLGGMEVSADTEGATREIKKDGNDNNMESVINGEDDPGSEEEGLRENMVWDENAQCWRFYAVYAD